uniref:Coatomer subunit epsilon n=1 Tax=Helicotheca tamesis TaxID=374047 RepID=A0A7S2I3C3_9STRA|mmetsp:Transcript_5257/g.7195  ORF Transcript_5257/g.7195 Transcript_5257/m.7195 type:complete len:302 (+) Transcript_5257:127-1032(+)
MDPDELYTLRAQFWLGHYNLCIEECKATARRPMSATLKAEREEFLLRAQLALGQYDRVIKECSGGDKSSAIQAIGLQAQYESSSDDETAKENIIDKLKTMLADDASSTSLQLISAHVFLKHGMTREALQCVHLGATMEHLAVALQIYLRIDRIDLAHQQLELLRQADEDAVLTQLGMVYVAIATGRSMADDAIHHLNSLSEQYGQSPMLLNITAVAYMTAGNMEGADSVLMEARSEHGCGDDADTLVNTVVCYQHMGKGQKDIEPLLTQLKSLHPQHPFVQGLVRVEGAFEREALKYAVKA